MRTADQIITNLRTSIDSKLSGIKTGTGEPIDDLIAAVAIEQARMNVLVEYLRRVNSTSGWRELLADTDFQVSLADAFGISTTTLDPQLARSLSIPPSITTDIDAVLFYDLGRYAVSLGRARRNATYSTAVLRVYLLTNAPITLLRGATAKASRSAVLYDSTLDLITATPGLDLVQNSYYVDVAVQARQAGRVGNAIPGSINTIVSGFTGVSSVTNPAVAEGGQDVETNDQLLTALDDQAGLDINTVNGLKRYASARAGVIDALVVQPGDSLMERSAGGAVDVYVIGTTLKTATSVVRVLQDGDSVPLAFQPVRSVLSVSAGSPLSEGNAFEIATDEGVFRGSAKANTVLQFFTAANGGPAVGTDVSIQYTYNDLIRDLQRPVDQDPDVNVPSSSILFKEATRLSIFLEIKAVPFPGIDQTTAEAAIQTAVSDLIDSKSLGDGLDYSDVLIAAGEAEQDGLRVIDRIDVFRIGLAADSLTTSNISAAGNQYVRTESLTFLV